MIDPNGTHHHLLLGAVDWERCTSPPGRHEWHYDSSARVVTLVPQVLRFPQPPGDPVLAPGARRGAARDPFGHWYWIGPTRDELRVRWSQGDRSERYWTAALPPGCATPAPGPFAPVEPAAVPEPEPLAGLAVTAGHYLVVGAPRRAQLLVFDLHTGGAPPRRIDLPALAGEPAPIEGERFDMAPLPGGGLLVLDRAYKVVWRLDALFRFVHASPPGPREPLLFQPKPAPGESGLERSRPAEATPAPIELADAIDPISIEPLTDDAFLVLDRVREVEALPDGTLLVPDRAGAPPALARFAIVRHYGPAGAPALDAIPLREEHLRAPAEPPLVSAEQPLAIAGHDLAFVAEGDDPAQPGVLYVVDAGGNQAFALDLRLEGGLILRLRRAFYPLRGHTGKALVAPPGAPHPFFDQADRWLPVAVLPRQRYAAAATIDLPLLDGREPGCVWHRVCLDACIPNQTRVRVLTRAADDPALLTWQEPAPEPLPYKRDRGAELPYYQLWSSVELRHAATGTWETLLQQARGRYLAIRLELEGNERETPRLRALRAHYPRFSYLTNYLPDVYQEDPVSASFLERFLANPEGLFTQFEGQIAAAQVLWDARTTPADALEWLASWVGLAFDPSLDAYRRRLLLAYAPAFFQRRGTRTGIVQAIRLAIDPCPGPHIFQGEYDDRRAPVRVVERYRTRRVPGVVAGDPTATDAPAGDPLQIARDRAHRFTVLLPADVSDEQVALVERLVEAEKPAHTFFTVKRYWDLFRVGEALLGLDTRLGAGGRFEVLRLGETALAEGALGAAYPFDLRDRNVVR